MNKQKNTRPERGELLFSRVFRYSAPRATAFSLLPVLGALITGIAARFSPASNTLYFSLFLPCAALGVLLSGGSVLSHLYRAFPRPKDGNGSVISAALLISGLLSVFLSLLSGTAGAGILGAIALIPEAERFSALLGGHFAGVLVSFFSVYAFLISLLITLMLTILLAKVWKKRRGVSRTCLCALPVFSVFALYYTGVFFLSTFTSLNALQNLASEDLLTENLLWILLTLGGGALPLSLLLTPILLGRANRLPPPDTGKK